MPARLLISETAAYKLRYAAAELPNMEVSGFGRVRVNPDGNEVELLDIVIPPQEVGGAHVDIGPEVRDAFYTEVIRNGCGGAQCERRSEETNGRDEGWEKVPAREKVTCTGPFCKDGTAIWRDPNEGDAFCAECYDNWIHMHDERCNNGNLKEWRVWWHKHPGNGKPSPSHTDTTTLEELAGPKGFRFGWMIGLIISADASNAYCWAEYAGEPFHMVLNDVPVTYEHPERPKLRDLVKRQMERVKVKTYTGGNHSYNNYNRGKKQHWDPKERQWVDDDEQNDTPQRMAQPEQKQLPAGTNAVKEIRPSKDFPGSIEIERTDGTVIVTKDTGQTRGRYQKHSTLPADKTPGSRAPSSIRKRVATHVSREGIHWVGQGTAAELQGRDGTTYIGFDYEGEPLSEGEERYLYYELDHKLKAIVADSKYRRQTSIEDQLNEVDRAIIGSFGDDHIGYDCEGTPLRKGEEKDLCYGVDGDPLFEGIAEFPKHGLDAEELQKKLMSQYNMPVDILDESDMMAYAALMGGWGGV